MSSTLAASASRAPASASIAELAENAGLYGAQLAKLVDRVVNILPTTVGDIDVEAQIRELAQLPLTQVGGLLLGTTNAVAKLLSNSMLVLVIVLFLLLRPQGLIPEEPVVSRFVPRARGPSWPQRLRARLGRTGAA